jgi:hypothetical protein
MGRERKRSDIPFEMSVLSPIPVYMVTSRMAMTSVPGRMNCR